MIDKNNRKDDRFLFNNNDNDDDYDDYNDDDVNDDDNDDNDDNDGIDTFDNNSSLWIGIGVETSGWLLYIVFCQVVLCPLKS